jgi:predicted protein tyrosine phosphatase
MNNPLIINEMMSAVTHSFSDFHLINSTRLIHPAGDKNGRIILMFSFSQRIAKGIELIRRRLRTQGLRTTLIWAYGRGLPAITGVPLLQFCQVTPQLYVGSQFNANGKQKLEKTGITAVINMRIEWDDAVHNLAFSHYLHLPTVDDTAPTVENVKAGIQFIRNNIDAGGKVYIHCGGGIGRAPTMAAAYLIAEGNTLDQALAAIRKVRPFIFITPPQMELLRQFSKHDAPILTTTIEGK